MWIAGLIDCFNYLDLIMVQKCMAGRIVLLGCALTNFLDLMMVQECMTGRIVLLVSSTLFLYHSIQFFHIFAMTKIIR